VPRTAMKSNVMIGYHDEKTGREVTQRKPPSSVGKDDQRVR
jgi:hypothetical protein